MGRLERYQPKSPEIESSLGFQAYCLQLSPYTTPQGEVKTLDVIKVYPSGTAVLVDCSGSGVAYDPRFSDVISEADQLNKDDYLVIKEIVDQSTAPSELELATFDTCLTASITDTGISYSGYGSGAIFAIHLNDVHEEYIDLSGIDFELVYFSTDAKGPKSLVSGTKDGVIGYILVSDGVATLGEEPVISVKKQNKDEKKTICGQVNRLYSSAESIPLAFAEFFKNIRTIEFSQEPSDDATILVVLNKKFIPQV